MSTHELDLLENAIDSLNEALAKFKQGEDGNEKAYKFAVLHMAHFIELLLKHHVSQKHALLIFAAPFAAKLDRNKTIGLWEAIDFINNESPESVSGEFRKDLEWLKRLRNDIEHHKFQMDVAQTRKTLGRLFRSVLEFLEEFSDIELKKHVAKDTIETFTILSDEYEFDRKEAINDRIHPAYQAAERRNKVLAFFVRDHCVFEYRLKTCVHDVAWPGFQNGVVLHQPFVEKVNLLIVELAVADQALRDAQESSEGAIQIVLLSADRSIE